MSKILNHINTNAILWIEVHDKRPVGMINWFPEIPEKIKKGWFKTEVIQAVPAGWFEGFAGYRTRVTEEQILSSNKWFSIDHVKKVCYESPQVLIYISAGERANKEVINFSTLAEATAYAKQIADEIPHITVKYLV